MIRVRVMLTLVLIAALLWESEARFSWRNRNSYSRRYRRTRPMSVCSNHPSGWSPGVVSGIGCSYPYHEGETCGFTCRDGYRQTSGDTSRTCSGGSWSGQPLVCEYTGCTRHPPYSRFSWRKGCFYPYESGENCTYECRDGYTAVSGDSVLTCRDGAWSGTMLTCNYTGCDHLPYTRGTRKSGCWYPYVNGESCTYTCRNGFSRVSGDPSITCQNGTWSGAPLTCMYTGCKRPPSTEGTSRAGCRWPFETGENCTYTCRNGYSRVSGDPRSPVGTEHGQGLR
ncbi:complement factor H-like [Branchiostoma floridae x Branchiostoma japonicum]